MEETEDDGLLGPLASLLLQLLCTLLALSLLELFQHLWPVLAQGNPTQVVLFFEGWDLTLLFLDLLLSTSWLEVKVWERCFPCSYSDSLLFCDFLPVNESSCCLFVPQKVQTELEGIKKDLEKVAVKTQEALASAQTSASAPVLRSELELTVQKMDHAYMLSSVYLEK